MSTRCSIIIKSECRNEKYIYLYHHHDGYPSGVGANILNYLKKEWNNGFWYADMIANDLVKGKQPSMYFETTGKYPNLKAKRDEDGNVVWQKDEDYEIAIDLHGDIDYIYVINCRARTLRCVGSNTLQGMKHHLVPIEPQDDYYNGVIED